MEIVVKYTYTTELIARLWTERARPTTAAVPTIAIDAATLSPETRARLLEGRTCGANGWNTLALTPEQASTAGSTCAANKDRLEIHVPELADSEPDEAQARADIERLVVVAEDAAKAVSAAREETERAAAAERAALLARIRERDPATIAQQISAYGYLSRSGGKRVLGRQVHVNADLSACARHVNHLGAADVDAILEEACDVDIRVAVLEAERIALLDEERAALRAAHLTDWVSRNALDLLPRHERGLLPEEELHARIRETLFAPLCHQQLPNGVAHLETPRYEKIRASDIVHADECYHEQPSFESGPVADYDRGLTAEEFEALSRIETLAQDILPSATVEPRVHVGWCRACDPEGAEVFRPSAKVTVEMFGRTFSREYAL